MKSWVTKMKNELKLVKGGPGVMGHAGRGTRNGLSELVAGAVKSEEQGDWWQSLSLGSVCPRAGAALCEGSGVVNGRRGKYLPADPRWPLPNWEFILVLIIPHICSRGFILLKLLLLSLFRFDYQNSWVMVRQLCFCFIDENIKGQRSYVT